MSPSATKAFSALFEGLTARQRDVITGSFGLEKFKEPQTLAALGLQHRITRERVRQIKAATLKTLKRSMRAAPACQALAEESVRRLKAAGGVMQEEALLRETQGATGDLTAHELRFLAAVSETFFFSPEGEHAAPCYYIDRNSLTAALRFIAQWIKYLRSHKSRILEEGYDAHFKKFVERQGAPLRHAQNYASIAKQIRTNPYGDTGLAEWEEIKPATVRDRIYLVLKKKGEPLHFEAITAEINRMRLRDRPALVPTVHNELIKDPRFVLIGRGTYALAEAGYVPGTAREVIERILKQHGPLTAGDIVRHVQRERIFKPNTVLVNLQNREYFERLSDGAYRIREA